ncbi:hypothetical protein MY3296_009600 [Beauveria thailandica]
MPPQSPQDIPNRSHSSTGEIRDAPAHRQRAAWEALEDNGKPFFAAAAFRQAADGHDPETESRPGKVKGWRPISLLSCLGKGPPRTVIP